MATTIWIAYLLINFVLIPLLFLMRHRRWPLVVPIVPRHRYDLLEHGYGWLVTWFTIALLCEPPTTVDATIMARAAGGGLVLVGSAIIAAAVLTLGPNWRIGQDTSDALCAYVTAGIYRYVSHPIYWGMMLVALGQTLLMSGDWRAIVLLAGTALYVVIQGRAELRRWQSA